MATTTPNKAAILRSPKSALVVEERPIPTPGPGDILVRNHTIALNPVDWKRRDWLYNIPSYPAILGSEVSGFVTTVDPSVTSFKPGDRVTGWADAFISHKFDRGAFQTYTLVKAISAVHLPATMPFAKGVTLPTGMVTSTLALFDSLKFSLPEISNSLLPPRKNETILIWGGASAVGWHAIQIARKLGLNVITIASEKHHDTLRSIGANLVVDYHSSTVVDDLVSAAEESGKPITCVIDCVSLAESLVPVLEVLARSSATHKKLVTILPWPEAVPAAGVDIETHGVQAAEIWTRREDLCVWLFGEALPKWLESGEIVPMRYRAVEGGVDGLESAMGELKKGASGEKIIVHVE